MSLDVAMRMLRNGNIHEGMEEAFTFLRGERKRASREEWFESIRDNVVRHDIESLIFQDPFTHHSYCKPRGYAGDAGLIDYIYGYRDAPSASPIASGIYHYTTNAPACKAVRYRRLLVAKTIDRLAHDLQRPIRVLSIAAGHLREVDLSEAVGSGALEEYVALDQDTESIRLIDSQYRRLGVTAMEGSVRGILAGKYDLREFDLVYASGLFDYLNQATGQRLAARMFDALRPGGEVLIANFLPDIHDVGYMETFMDWHLIYRTDDEARALLAEVPQAALGDVKVTHDPYENVVFVAAQKEA